MFTKLVPLTTRPLSTSRQGMTRFRSIRCPILGRRARGNAKTERAKDAGRRQCRKPLASPRTQAQRRLAASAVGAWVRGRASLGLRERLLGVAHREAPLV